MAIIAITLAPVLTVALSLVSTGSLVSVQQPQAGNPLHTLNIAASQTVLATVGEVLRGPRGLQGSPGSAGLLLEDVELIATQEAQELRLDMDALVLATLSI